MIDVINCYSGEVVRGVNRSTNWYIIWFNATTFDAAIFVVFVGGFEVEMTIGALYYEGWDMAIGLDAVFAV